jgi:hypothetical protein
VPNFHLLAERVEKRKQLRGGFLATPQKKKKPQSFHEQLEQEGGEDREIDPYRPYFQPVQFFR